MDYTTLDTQRLEHQRTQAQTQLDNLVVQSNRTQAVLECLSSEEKRARFHALKWTIDFNNTPKDSVSEIIIPEGIQRIKPYFAYMCKNATKIQIPNSVTNIADSAFYNCYSASEIIFSNALLTIGEESFMNCSSVKEIYLPESLTSIGRKAFTACSNLERVEILSPTCTIYENAFSLVPSTCDVYINSTTKSVKNQAGFPFGFETRKIIHCSDGDLMVP